MLVTCLNSNGDMISIRTYTHNTQTKQKPTKKIIGQCSNGRVDIFTDPPIHKNTHAQHVFQIVSGTVSFLRS